MTIKNKKIMGFTLAEVLITLGVIGVVAALTIPTLFANYQKKVYVTQLKKAYSEINQALIQLSADNGCIGDLKCTGLFNSTSRVPFGTEFVKYFKVAKDCGSTELGCLSNSVAYTYNGSGGRGDYDANAWADSYRFVTMDNISIYIYNVFGNYTGCAAGWSTHKTNNLTQICSQIDIDVNGPSKGPNNFGKDIFKFYISNGKGPLLYPFGGPDDGGNPFYWCDSSAPYGDYCAARIMNENWEMNYDDAGSYIVPEPPPGT